nr:MAG TPA: FAD-dependent thymidylate synthase [Caudoviricetes sp.]
MKLIKPNVEIIEQQPGLEGMYKQIELAGRTCYKSEDKITEDSAKAFVDRMIKSGHGAMLEHGTVYLKLPTGLQLSDKYKKNKYSIITLTPGIDPYWAVTTNYRVLVENNWLDDLQYICEPTEYHEKRITVKWTCDRVTGESFLRHRVFSFARESTRYCNYSKDKFGNELTFMIPTWVDDIPDNTILHNRMEVDNYVWGDISKQIKDKGMATIKTSEFTRTFLYNSIDAEINYMHLVSMGYKPQQARQILPFSIHSPLVMTGFESDWKGFFALRSPRYGATGVHPDAAYLADKLYDLLYIEKDYDFSLIHHDAFDGECSFLNDGDMITYHSLHDKNKDSYTIESVTITPKEGEIRTLSREEYLKLTNNTSN